MNYGWVMILVFSVEAPAVIIEFPTEHACERERMKIETQFKSERFSRTTATCVKRSDR